MVFEKFTAIVFNKREVNSIVQMWFNLANFTDDLWEQLDRYVKLRDTMICHWRSTMLPSGNLDDELMQKISGKASM